MTPDTMLDMPNEYGQPLAQVLGDGFRVPPLLPGWTALEGVVLVKCLDAEGHPSWAFRETEGMNVEEVIGILTVQLDMLRERAVDAFRDLDD